MRIGLKKKALVLACGLFAASFEAQGAPPSPPRVHAVYVDSSSWASAFKSNLAAIGVGSATLGYKIPTAYNSAMRSGVLPHQLKTSPWINIDTIHVAFSENVQITASDFAIKGVNGSNNEVVYSGTFNYNSTTHVATWTAATAFDVNKLLVIVSGEVRSQATGVKLAGGWTNPDPSVPRNGSVFPSGGSPGETFFFRANILPGAVTRSAIVGNSDMSVVLDKLGSNAGGSVYTPFADNDGNGYVNTNDLSNIQPLLFSQLPSNEPTLTMPPPTAPPTTTTIMPSTTTTTMPTTGWTDVTVGSDTTYRDNTTGLWWSNDRGSMPWQSGIDHCANLSYNGRDNWRMPNISELETGYNNNGFRRNSGLIPVSSWWVWSSSTQPYNTSSARYIHLFNGFTGNNIEIPSASVLCVSP